MKGTDRFLIGIVAGVVLLVGVVIALALLRPGEADYQPEDRPEGVAHNYLLALQREDYERAYGYLSPTLSGYPADVREFTDDVEARGFSGYEDVSLAVDSVKATGDGAVVVVRRTIFYTGGLFDSGQYTTRFDMTLRRDGDGWKVVESDRYWWRCWTNPSGSGCQ